MRGNQHLLQPTLKTPTMISKSWYFWFSSAYFSVARSDNSSQALMCWQPSTDLSSLTSVHGWSSIESRKVFIVSTHSECVKTFALNSSTSEVSVEQFSVDKNQVNYWRFLFRGDCVLSPILTYQSQRNGLEFTPQFIIEFHTQSLGQSCHFKNFSWHYYRHITIDIAIPGLKLTWRLFRSYSLLSGCCGSSVKFIWPIFSRKLEAETRRDPNW